MSIVTTRINDAQMNSCVHENELKAALHLIRYYITQPNKAAECNDHYKQRAKSVLASVRSEVDLIGKQMLTDFEVGPVACIVSTPASDGAKFGRASLSFGVHTPDSDLQQQLGVTVEPLYKD